MRAVFVGGTGRSGTSILKTKLDKHPQVCGTPHELRFHIDPDGLVDLLDNLTDRWSPYTADIALHRFRRLMLDLLANRITTNRQVKKVRTRLMERGVNPWRYRRFGAKFTGGRERVQSSLDQLYADIVRGETSGIWMGSPAPARESHIWEAGPLERDRLGPRLGEFFLDIATRQAKSGHEVVVEDTPYNILHAPVLLDMLPDSKILHIYRDPLDVLPSYLTHDWGGSDLRLTADRLRVVLERWFKVRDELPAASYRDVSLETVAVDPVDVTKDLCAFIDLPYAQELESVPLAKPNSGRWKQDLSSSDVDIALEVLSGVRSQLGYS